MIEAAHNLADDMEMAFRVATQDIAPAWHHQQRRGFVEPRLYKTRQPGDMEFFRNYVDNGNPGHDMEVSLFLDISGSMMGTGNQLGAAAWAMKTSCDRLDIVCSVHLFNDRAYTLWNVDDRPAVVPNVTSCGGTNPSDAFAAVLGVERDKKHHIVMVMTDGDWSRGSTVADFHYPNVYAVSFFYTGELYGNSDSSMLSDAALAAKLGTDEGYRINDLMQMPGALESLLLALV
jgi:hypothetical protein